MKIAADLKALCVPVDSLHLDPANLRAEHDLEAIKASLREFGQLKAIVTNRSGKVIAGNGTLQAAIDIGAKQIARVRMSSSQIKQLAFAIADNRTSELSAWAGELDVAVDSLRDSLPDLVESLRLDDLLESLGLSATFEPEPIDAQGKLDELKQIECPECGHEFKP